MKANELMIGDWVRICYVNKFEGKVDKVFQVGQIRDDYGELCVWAIPTEATRGNMGALEPRYGESNIFPIPLTPEILEGNGFRKLVTYCTEKWVCNNLRLNVYDSGETWRFCVDTNRNENSVIYIRFVHELQHALRLCGIDKEITI